jgi:hypothetical protein
MKILIDTLKNQSGSMIVVVIMMLAVLTIIGIASVTTSKTEQQTATMDQIHKMAFFAAEAGRSFVTQNSDLYHDDNTIAGGALSFPDPTNADTRYEMWAQQAFNGTVEYIGPRGVPRNSGFEAGTYRAHNYRILSNGYGPRSSQSRIEAVFYRIGY